MRAQFLNLLHDIRGSYWFVPSVMVLSSILLAVATDRIDAHLDRDALSSIDWLFQSQAEGARAVLTAIATSMIGVAGVTFSMTLVAVSFAASNIGPRLIGNFMRDTGNQVTLGTFIATFVYSLLILRRVTDGDTTEFADGPQVAVLVAMILALISVSNLIYFIHHVPESINVANIAHAIADDLRAEVMHLFPVKGNDQADPNPQQATTGSRADAFSPAFRVESQAIRAPCDGYLQVIDMDTAMKITQEHDLILRLEYRPGDFVIRDSLIAYAHPSARVTPAIAAALVDCIVIGSKRTRSQNVLFLVDQLVEIMIRALSPGVNDPFTAVGCLDWLSSALAEVVQRQTPDQFNLDADDNLRVAVYQNDFEQIADATFGPSIQYVAADRTACMRMMEVIAELVASTENAQYRATLLKHARALNQTAQSSLPVVADRELINERYQQTVRIAHDPGFENRLRDSQGWLGGRG